MFLEVDNNKFSYSEHGEIKHEYDNGVQEWTNYIPECANVGILSKSGMPYTVIVFYEKYHWLVPLNDPSREKISAVRNLFSGYCLQDEWLN